jgi:Escherichia/Staphylococcus phage prohead protease
MTRRSAVMEAEHRGLPSAAARIAIRAADKDADGERFVGHAAVFDVRTSIGNPLKWGFYEELASGAFTKTLKECDARFLLDHDSYYVVSRMTASTLTLKEDKVGLAVDSDLDVNLSYVKDLKANVRNGNITGMSFGFYVVKDQWSTEEVEVSGSKEPIEVEVRRILEVRLVEVSAVTFPAYDATDAGLRDVTRTLRGRGDAEAIKRRIEFRPELAELLDEIPRRKASTVEQSTVEDDVVESTPEEPGESTPRSQSDSETEDESTEPAETTRIAPSDELMAAARLRVLRTQLRRPVAA